jgi:hypothetical protein
VPRVDRPRDLKQEIEENHPMPKIGPNLVNAHVTLEPTPKLDISKEKLTSGEKAAAQHDKEIEAHVEPFSADGSVVKIDSTRKMLAALGLTDKLDKLLDGPALTVVFSADQAEARPTPPAKDASVVEKLKFFLKLGAHIKKGAQLDHTEISRINEGIRADGSDTGIFDKATGKVNAQRFVDVWTEFAGTKGYMTEADMGKLVQGKFPNGLEFGLLFALAGVTMKDGTKALPLDRALAFYDGSLFHDLADARASGKLYKPTGVLVHDGPRQVAATLSKLALEKGGNTAGAAAMAMSGGKLAMTLPIDEAASLAEQQSTKSLASTFEAAIATSGHTAAANIVGATYTTIDSTVEAGAKLAATAYAGAAMLMCPFLPGATKDAKAPPVLNAAQQGAAASAWLKDQQHPV